jgi:hypothetical protein
MSAPPEVALQWTDSPGHEGLDGNGIVPPLQGETMRDWAVYGDL